RGDIWLDEDCRRLPQDEVPRARQDAARGVLCRRGVQPPEDGKTAGGGLTRTTEGGRRPRRKVSADEIQHPAKRRRRPYLVELAGGGWVTGVAVETESGERVHRSTFPSPSRSSPIRSI